MEGVSGIKRARGRRSSEVSEDELELKELDSWENIVARAVATQCAHSIKCVYAVYALAKSVRQRLSANSNFEALVNEVDLLARRSSVIAVALEIE